MSTILGDKNADSFSGTNSFTTGSSEPSQTPTVYGETWTMQPSSPLSPVGFSKMFISDNGSIQIGFSPMESGRNLNILWYSSNSGETWTTYELTEERAIWSACMNYDGSIIYVFTGGTKNNSIYSFDGSTGTFTRHANMDTILPHPKRIGKMACSEDGSYIVICAAEGGSLAYSENNGFTWTRSGSGSNLCMSTNGQIIYTMVYNNGRNNITQSTDSGVTWRTVARNLPTVGNGHNNFSCSSDGVYVFTCVLDGYPYYSNDSGATWNQLSSSGLPPSIPYKEYLTCACDSTGKYVTYVLVHRTGYEVINSIWCSSNYGLTFTEVSNLQVIPPLDHMGIVVGGAVSGDSTTQVIIYFNEGLDKLSYLWQSTHNVINPICFPAGTPVQTDQGTTAIEKINCKKHTIKGKKIVAITKTVTMEDTVICIEKDSLGQNIPSQQTIISRNHKLLYNKEMIKAKNLIGKVEGVYNKKYNGEVLYNVLLERHNTMMVNNLVVETLDPKNIIAKLYNGSYSEEQKNNIIININKCAKEYNKEYITLKK